MVAMTAGSMVAAKVESLADLMAAKLAALTAVLTAANLVGL